MAGPTRKDQAVSWRSCVRLLLASLAALLLGGQLPGLAAVASSSTCDTSTEVYDGILHGAAASSASAAGRQSQLDPQEAEQLTTTLNHPFWPVTDQRFEPVSDLSPGEQVLTAEGTTLTVTGIKTHAAHTGWAYNLSVNTIHTYHVGTHHTLVHNTCPTNHTPTTNSGSRIAGNKAIGDAAADVIASQYPGALREVTLQAASGTRRLDVLTPQGLAIESKVGRTSLTKATGQQIQRDVELMNDPLSGVSSVEWPFGTSPVTGLGGPAGPLEAALRATGIGIR